jgi:hypothetical protein
MARWSVHMIRNRAEYLGVVTAPDEKRALAKAIKFFTRRASAAEPHQRHQNQPARRQLRAGGGLHNGPSRNTVAMTRVSIPPLAAAPASAACNRERAVP